LPIRRCSSSCSPPPPGPLADHRFHVGVIHDGNASRKATSDPYWRSVPVEDVEALLGADAAFYREASSRSSRGKINCDAQQMDPPA
jgi:hypothetical protein